LVIMIKLQQILIRAEVFLLSNCCSCRKFVIAQIRRWRQRWIWYAYGKFCV
jgi:hypothetical protein